MMCGMSDAFRTARDLLLRYKSTEELDAMRALKAAFDPKNILNPGKVVPPVKRL